MTTPIGVKAIDTPTNTSHNASFHKTPTYIRNGISAGSKLAYEMINEHVVHPSPTFHSNKSPPPSLINENYDYSFASPSPHWHSSNDWTTLHSPVVSEKSTTFSSAASSQASSSLTSPKLTGIRRLKNFILSRIMHQPKSPSSNALSIFYSFLSRKSLEDDQEDASESSHRQAICSMLEMMSAETGLDQAMECVITAARSLVKVEAIALFMVEQDRGLVICKAQSIVSSSLTSATQASPDADVAQSNVIDSGVNIIIGKRYNIGSGIVGRVAQTGKPVRASDVDPNDTIFANLTVSSLLCLPISDAYKHVRAVLVCANKLKLPSQSSTCRRHSANNQSLHLRNSLSHKQHQRRDSAPTYLLNITEPSPNPDTSIDHHKNETPTSDNFTTLPFDSSDEDMLLALSTSSGQLLRKAQLFQQLVNEQRKTRALIQVLQADEMSEHVDLYMYRILTIAHAVMPCERVALFFIDSVREDMYCVCLSSTEAERRYEAEYLPIKRKGIPFWVASTACMANVHNAQEDERYDNSFDTLTNSTTHSCLCMPVVQSNGSVLAVFMSVNKSRSDGMIGVFSDEDEDILAAWTLQVGSTMRRRLPEVAISRTRRELNDDKQILSLMQLYGNTRSSILNNDSDSSETDSNHELPVRKNQLSVDPSTPPTQNELAFIPSANSDVSTSDHIYSTVMPMSVNKTSPHSIAFSNTMFRQLPQASPAASPPLTASNSPLLPGPGNAQLYRSSSMQQSSGRFLDNPSKLISMSNFDLDNANVLPAFQTTTRSPVSRVPSIDLAQPIRRIPAQMIWPSIVPSTLPSLQVLASLSFCAFDYTEDQLLLSCLVILEDLNLVTPLQLTLSKLQSFLLVIRSKYRDNPYHNFYHGFSVMQFGYFMVRQSKIKDVLSPMDQLALLISCLCHDVDHPGTTNGFQINTDSILARIHNQNAVLENHHAYVTCEVLRDGPTHFLDKMTFNEFKDFRRIVIQSILSTDMAVHFELCKQFSHLEGDLANYNSSRESDRQMVMNLVVHSSDLSGQVMEIDVASQWEEKVTSEFIAQAVSEEELGLPVSQFMKGLNDNSIRFKNHLNFIDFVMTPLWTTVAAALPPMKQCVQQLHLNRKIYAERIVKIPNIIACENSNSDTSEKGTNENIQISIPVSSP